MNRLIVLRHGRTEWNRDHRLQGAADVALDEVGRRQAAAAAECLAAMRPVSVVSSDLSRAVDTAVPLAELAGAPLRLDKRLRERSYGPWEGLTHPEIKAGYPKEFEAWKAREPFDLAGVESPETAATRGAAALADCVAGDEPGTVVAVTHGGISRIAVGRFLGWDSTVIDVVRGLGNCAWADLQRGRSAWLLNGFNLKAACE